MFRVLFSPGQAMNTTQRWMLAMLLLIASSAYSQSTQGSIFGTVTDSGGAVLPHANVTVTSVERGVTRATVTNDAGQYRISDLELGSYIVGVEAKGFQKANSTAIEITIKAIVRVDMPLQLGTFSQTVKVEAGSTLIRTGSAEVSNVIDLQDLQQLPVISRNPITIASLTAGTAQGNATGRQAITSGAEVVVNGTPPEGNNFIIDGVSNNMEFSGTIAARPPMDALQEFAVQVSQYSAEFGRGAGGIINMSLKSGSNQFHGFAYDYLQNTVLIAQPYNFTGQVQPNLPVHRNQYGVGAGGPILKSKLFWFFNWEGLNYTKQTLGQFVVPTAAEKTGDFSQAGFDIYDPTTAAPSPSNPSLLVRQQFPGDIIPKSRIDPTGSALMSYYPNPNYTSTQAGILTNYLQSVPSTQTGNTFVGKIDLNFSASDALSAHYVQQLLYLGGTGLAPAVTGAKTSENGTNTGATYTHVFNPRLLNEARISYNRFVLGATSNFSQNIMDQYKIPGWPTGQIARGFPQVSPANITVLAQAHPLSWIAAPTAIIENTYQYMDTASWQIGKHSVKFGIEFDNLGIESSGARSGGGVMTFNGAYTTQTVGGLVSSPRTGVADMLLGDASAFTVRYVPAPLGLTLKTFRLGEFVQDDWRVSPSLTFNLGLRYDIYRPYHEEQDRVQNFDLATGTVLLADTARSFAQNALGFPNGNLPPNWAYVPRDQIYVHTNFGDVSPRIGFVYVVNQHVSVRSGFGFFYDQTVDNTFNNSGLGALEFSPTATIATPETLSGGLPSGGITNITSSNIYPPYYGPLNRPDPYSEKYGLNVDWSPRSSFLLDIGYAGSDARKFPTLVPGNMPQTPGPGTLQTRQPYPNFGFFWKYLPVDSTNYNGLTLSVTARNIHGLFVKSAYTYSKTMGYDTASDGTLVTPYNLNYDYGPLDFDLTHRWVTSAVYKLPIPTSFGPVARSLLGGWESSGIFTLESGFPFTPTDSVTLNVGSTGGSGQRPNRVPNVPLEPSRRTINSWYNTAAFAHPTIYTWGNAGKNILRGPGMNELDCALQKRFALPWEGHSAVIRMEGTNVFNHPSWGTPSASFSSSAFGIIQSTQNSMRIAQAAFRYEF
jgi:hypothetical protein